MAAQSKKNILSRQNIGFKDVQLFKDQVLGIGSYGAVCNALCDDLPCAAKIIHPTLFDTASHHQIPRHKEHRLPIRRFEQECEFMGAIRHPNIVQYLGMYHDSAMGLPALLMELMDDSLTHFLETSTQPLPYHVEVNFCRDIILALSFLHSNGIVHRDLSSNNVLLIGTVRAKVADFGMARLSDLSHQTSHFTNTLCPGADVYMPPEAVKEKSSYNEKIDCFLFGVITIQILTKIFPNPGDRQRLLVVENLGSVYVPVPEIERRHNHISKIDLNHPLLTITIVCLNDDSDKRPSAQKLYKDIKALHRSNLYHESNTAYSTCIFSTKIGTGHIHELAADKTSGERHTLKGDNNTQTLKPSEECASIISREQESSVNNKSPSEMEHSCATEPKSQVLMTEETKPSQSQRVIKVAHQDEYMDENSCHHIDQPKLQFDQDLENDKEVTAPVQHNSSEFNCLLQEKLAKNDDNNSSTYICCGAELVDSSQGITVIAGCSPEPDIGPDAKNMHNSSEVEEEVECSKEVQDDLNSSDTPDKPLQRKRKFTLFSRHKKEKSRKPKKDSGKDKKSRMSKKKSSQDRREEPSPKLEEEGKDVQQHKKGRKFFKRRTKKEMRVLMMGLDAAGKTTMLYKMKLDENVTTIPTIGFNVETVSYNQMHFTIWDIGGQDKIQPLWQHYFGDTQAVIWVIDSKDHQRLTEARYELHRILDDERMKDVIVLVYANKQDLADAMSPAEIQEKMGLTRLHSHNWHIQPSCATAGEGLHEGLLWLKLQHMYNMK